MCQEGGEAPEKGSNGLDGQWSPSGNSLEVLWELSVTQTNDSTIRNIPFLKCIWKRQVNVCVLTNVFSG